MLTEKQKDEIKKLFLHQVEKQFGDKTTRQKNIQTEHTPIRAEIEDLAREIDLTTYLKKHLHAGLNAAIVHTQSDCKVTADSIEEITHFIDHCAATILPCLLKGASSEQDEITFWHKVTANAKTQGDAIHVPGFFEKYQTSITVASAVGIFGMFAVAAVYALSAASNAPKPSL